MTKHTDFYARLDDLQQRVATTRAAAHLRPPSPRNSSRQRIDRAQADLDQSAKNAQQQISQAAESGRAKWAQLKADAAAKMSDVKADVDKRTRQIDAKAAARMWTGQKPTRPTPSTCRLGGRERTAGDARRHPRSRHADKLAKAADNS
jgi:hypothetical protein